jgi:hypothetical protein
VRRDPPSPAIGLHARAGLAHGLPHDALPGTLPLDTGLPPQRGGGPPSANTTYSAYSQQSPPNSGLQGHVQQVAPLGTGPSCGGLDDARPLPRHGSAASASDAATLSRLSSLLLGEQHGRAAQVSAAQVSAGLRRLSEAQARLAGPLGLDLLGGPLGGPVDAEDLRALGIDASAEELAGLVGVGEGFRLSELGGLSGRPSAAGGPLAGLDTEGLWLSTASALAGGARHSLEQVRGGRRA